MKRNFATPRSATEFRILSALATEWATHITQTPLVESLLDYFQMTQCNAVKTPMEPHTLLTSATESMEPVKVRQYQYLVGELLQLTSWTRPDLCFATQQLVKWAVAPANKHWTAAMRVLKYLKGTKNIGITYTRGLPNANRLLAWADTDWASCIETRRSFSGYVSTLHGGGSILKCRQQMSVATSTSEAEYVAASDASDDVQEIRNMLQQAGCLQLYEDNRSCRMMSEPGFQ
jgi:hypothetical protein